MSAPATPVALVSGISSGIGREIAHKLVGTGFRVFGTVRQAEVAGPAGVTLLRVDVRSDEDVRAAVNAVVDAAGRIDVLVNNAGATLLGAIEETSLEQARELFDVNFFGALRLIRAVLPGMRAQKSGRLIHISSVLGFLPAPFMGLYAATKHATEAMSETLDHEVRGFGIRSVLVEPGFTRTAFGKNSSLADMPIDDYATTRDAVAAKVQGEVERGGDPADIARVMLRAALAKNPRLRYTAGRGASMLAMLRRFLPPGALDGGIRKKFGIAST